jgi:hypothetical protein
VRWGSERETKKKTAGLSRLRLMDDCDDGDWDCNSTATTTTPRTLPTVRRYLRCGPFMFNHNANPARPPCPAYCNHHMLRHLPAGICPCTKQGPRTTACSAHERSTMPIPEDRDPVSPSISGYIFIPKIQRVSINPAPLTHQHPISDSPSLPSLWLLPICSLALSLRTVSLRRGAKK